MISKEEISGIKRRTKAALGKWKPPIQNGRVGAYGIHIYDMSSHSIQNGKILVKLGNCFCVVFYISN